MAHITEEIYNTYKKPIYNYLYKVTFNSHIAEELTQDTFLKAFTYVNSFRGDASMKTWLFKIAHNTYVNYLKKNAGNTLDNLDDIITSDNNDISAESVEKYSLERF